MRYRWLLSIGLALACAALPGSRASAQEPVRARYGVLSVSSAAFSSSEIAKDMGLFAKRGLALETIAFDAGPAALAALASGSVQFAYVGPNVADAVVAGLPVVAIYGISNVPGQQVCVVESIKTAADLIGKTVTLPNRGSAHDVAFRTWLKDKNISESQLTIRNMDAGVAAMTAAAMAGAVQAYVSNPPRCDQTAKFGHHVLADLGQAGLKFFTAGVAVHRDFLKNNRATVAKFVAAMHEASVVFRDNREVAFAKISALEKENDPKIIEVVWNFYRTNWSYPPLVWGESVLEAIKNSLNERTREAGPSMLSQVFDNSVVEETVGR